MVDRSIDYKFLSTPQQLTTSFLLPTQQKSFQWKMRTPAKEDALTLTFLSGASAQPIRIGNILLYPWVDTGGIYTVEGHPRRYSATYFAKSIANRKWLKRACVEGKPLSPNGLPTDLPDWRESSNFRKGITTDSFSATI